MSTAPPFGTTWDEVPARPTSHAVWTLIVPLCVLFAWFPLGAYWQSDDFIALHYAQDLGRVAHDFVGPQYGAGGVWLFFRPLITLSFWIDQLFGGPHPMVSHLSNTLAHALSAWLVVLLWSRFVGLWAASLAGLLWALLPSHAGSILWAVGRVDSHTTVWILATLWLCCQGIEKHCWKGRWAAVGTFCLALMSKELAVVTPGLVAVLAFAIAAPGQRLRTALVTLWPFVLVLAGYLFARHELLGVWLGGYTAGVFEPIAAAQGLGNYLLDVVNPWRVGGDAAWSAWLTGPGAPGWLRDNLPAECPTWVGTLGYLPIVVALGVALGRRRFRLVAGALVGTLIATVPLAQFLDSDSLQSLRYFYLPTAALVGIFAAAGPLTALFAIAVFALPLLEVRDDYSRAHRDAETMHRLLLEQAADLPAGEPMFVAGLPSINDKGNVVQFHFGVDRLAAPPFVAAGPVVYPLRPALQVPGVFQLPSDPATALPEGTSWFFEGPRILGKLPEAPLPELSVEGVGIDSLDTERLVALAATDGAWDHPDAAFLICDSKEPAYRLTVFTSVGYVSAVVESRTMGQWIRLEGDRTRLNLFGIFRDAKVGLPGTPADQPMIDVLEVPTVADLDPAFPVLVEAGSLDLSTAVPTFATSARTRDLLRFRFDNRFPEFLRGTRGP